MTTDNAGAAIGLSNDNKLAVIGGLVANTSDPRAGVSSYIGNDCTDTWWDWNAISETVGFLLFSCNNKYLQWVWTGASPVTLGAASLVNATAGVITANVAGTYKAYFAPDTVIPAGMYLWVEAVSEIAAITFNAGDPIASPTLPVGVPVNINIHSHFLNGTPPVLYSVYSGSLPPGLTLLTNGFVTGTPTTVGATGAVVFRGSDSRGNNANSNAVTFTVIANVFTFTGPIPDQSNVEDSAITPVNISGYWSLGTTPYTYSVFSGTLPVGLILDPATGIISGTPTTPN